MTEAKQIYKQDVGLHGAKRLRVQSSPVAAIASLPATLDEKRRRKKRQARLRE